MTEQETKSWNRFANEYLHKLGDDHERISLIADFGKMCKKWGYGYIEFVRVNFKVWQENKEMQDVMTLDEFSDYYGAPKSFLQKLTKPT